MIKVHIYNGKGALLSVRTYSKDTFISFKRDMDYVVNNLLRDETNYRVEIIKGVANGREGA